MKIITAVYSHPEYYPPTLNALDILADNFEEVICVHRNVKKTDFSYSNRIKLITSGKFKCIRDSEQSSIIWKLVSFAQFTRQLYLAISISKPKWIILYDPFPFLAYNIIRLFLNHRPKVWYHNHDVLEPTKISKFSLAKLAYFNESKNLNMANIFSLPSNERKIYFNLANYKGKYFFLPNYPSKKRFKKRINTTHEQSSMKLIYQGHVGEGHGLEKIINFLAISNLNLMLTIIGIGDEFYINKLKKLIFHLKLQNRVKILGFIPYHELVDFSAQHDVGLAVHEPVNIAFKSAATASNKIYEYIATGMPVILFDDVNYHKLLGKYNWAKFTDLSMQSLESIFFDIMENLNRYSEQAQSDFTESLYFENKFADILLELN